MDVVCVGGGPAGLYFAICAMKLPGEHRVRVIERDPPGATFGWGVSYPDRALDLMFRHDPESAREVRARSVTWWEQEWRLHGRSAYVSHFSSGIERAVLLDVLGRRAVDVGVDVQYGRAVEDLTEFADADLVVASDGVGSTVRRQYGDAFGTTTHVGRNRFIWLGTDRVFPRITFAFERTPAGWIWMFAYPSSTTSSTCVVECSPDTWHGLGLDTMPSEQGLRLLEEVFGELLGGGRLFGQSRAEPSRWQRFQHMTNRTWCHGNVVLMGDAAHATHYTLGSGTRYALTDAATLADSLRTEPDLSQALNRYDGRRRERANRAVAAGRHRAEKWENREVLLERDVLDFIHAKNGVSDAELRRRRPLYQAEQLSAVRLVRRRIGATRRWYRARQAWPGDSGPTSAPAHQGAGAAARA
jgi:2-polyprenyl-6-methoxyphenol hydroxylase-like FAD-dependent oxidoreductase